MVRVIIYKDFSKKIVGYSIKGHSGYSTKGNDIICAAVSMLSQTVLISLNEVCGIEEENINYCIDEGFLEVSIPKQLNREKKDKSNIVMMVFEVGIKALIESYSQYITLKYREV